LKLEVAANLMNADVKEISPALLGAEFKTVSVDSRTVRAGDVFFAFSQPEFQNNGFNGEFRDAHEFIPQAFAGGAMACIARRDRFEEHKSALAKFRDRLLFVDDAILALQDLACGVYQNWAKPVVAITGSAGKTTAKEITSHILQFSGKRVLSNAKNLNNGIGHPLTVLRLLSEGEFDVAVLEMGMSTPMHEIARLCRITPPDFAVELNVLPVHVEFLGSIENVAKAKAELVEGMKPEGIAVLNADDARTLAMRELRKGKVVTFGFAKDADVRAEEFMSSGFDQSRFNLCAAGDVCAAKLPLGGRHNISNALAAAAVGLSFGISLRQICEALETVQPPPQRGEILHFREGFDVINDSYNSNPAALLSMVEMLIGGAANATRKIVLAGEMLELGRDEARIHHETGAKLAKSGIDALYGVRGLAKQMVEGARENGLRAAEFFANSDEAGEFLSENIRSGDLVLVKGSRGVRTEKIIEKLLSNFELKK
jgi:UDP-N-acetylmuramoyl-tripeptide--D-alanyl-D-alanine ligase